MKEFIFKLFGKFTLFSFTIKEYKDEEKETQQEKEPSVNVTTEDILAEIMKQYDPEEYQQLQKEKFLEGIDEGDK